MHDYNKRCDHDAYKWSMKVGEDIAHMFKEYKGGKHHMGVLYIWI
jgi:hypothetical protein